MPERKPPISPIFLLVSSGLLLVKSIARLVFEKIYRFSPLSSLPYKHFEFHDVLE